MVQKLLSLIEALPLAGLLAAQVVLPLVGVPVSPIWVATGVRAGALWGTVLSAGALAVNLSLGYWMARAWLRANVAPVIDAAAQNQIDALTAQLAEMRAMVEGMQPKRGRPAKLEESDADAE